MKVKNIGGLMKIKKIIYLVMILMIVFVAAGCAPGDGSYTPEEPAGFFWAIWHGWIAPFSVIIGFFNNDIRVYEVNNTGWAYDIGFYMAIISGFGGISLGRKSKK